MCKYFLNLLSVYITLYTLLYYLVYYYLLHYFILLKFKKKKIVVIPWGTGIEAAAQLIIL